MIADLSPLIIAHFMAAALALPLGLHQLLAPQAMVTTDGQMRATGSHALAGRIYVVAMLITNVSALSSYRPDTPFLPFHVLALVSLVSLLTGLLALRKWLSGREPRHLRSHKINMAYSWLGLAMAGVSQFASNPRFGFVQGFSSAAAFWTFLVVLNLVLYGVGTWWIFQRLLRAASGRPG